MATRPLLTLACLLLLGAVGCLNNQSSPFVAVSPATRAGYQESCNELDRLLRNTHEQIRQGNHLGAHQLFLSLIIPDRQSWFVKTFGPTLGPQLNLQYESQLGWQFTRLGDVFRSVSFCDGCQLSCEASGTRESTPFFRNIETLLQEAQVPIQVYFVSLSPKDADWSRVVGHFVYVEGGFRYLGYLEISPDWKLFFASYGSPYTP